MTNFAVTIMSVPGSRNVSVIVPYTSALAARKMVLSRRPSTGSKITSGHSRAGSISPSEPGSPPSAREPGASNAHTAAASTLA